MNQANDLKKFWEDVASGIWCSSFMGWTVDSVEGGLEKNKVVFSATDPEGAEVTITIEVDVPLGHLTFVAEEEGSEPMINSEYGAKPDELLDEQSMVDMISSIVDDNLWDTYFGSGLD